jgi:tyrosyl-tRNA synthetase
LCAFIVAKDKDPQPRQFSLSNKFINKYIFFCINLCGSTRSSGLPSFLERNTHNIAIFTHYALKRIVVLIVAMAKVEKVMPQFKSDILNVLQSRGFIYQGTDIEQLDSLCSEKGVTAYIGFDATAKSLQVGNLSAIMLLRWFQKLGHTPMVLLGGATSRIGDPSFRQEARPIMSMEQVQENIRGIGKVFSKLLDFGSAKNSAILVNNADWLIELRYVDFLRDFGSQFTINRMLSFDSVKSRLDKNEPLSFLEFNYMIMQAYDFYHLNKVYGCELQMGGADQWGNIVNGVELTRKLSRTSVFGLTAPLVTNASGVKMGKTAAGAVWLNEDMCAPYDYWQFWRNADDRDVGKYLRKFTELPLDEIQRLEALEGSEINEAKKILADEATTLVHGRDVLKGIHAAVGALFGDETEQGGSEAPKFSIERSRLPISLEDLFVLANLCASKGEFKRLVAGHGASFQDDVIDDPKYFITLDDFTQGRCRLSIGKKKHLNVELA